MKNYKMTIYLDVEMQDLVEGLLEDTISDVCCMDGVRRESVVGDVVSNEANVKLVEGVNRDDNET